MSPRVEGHLSDAALGFMGRAEMSGLGVPTALASDESQAVDVSSVVSSLSGWAVFFALVTLIVSWLASRVVRRSVLRLANRVQGLSRDLRVLAARMASYAVLFIGAGVALTMLGVQTQPLLTIAILIGVVAILALRGIADNFAAGIVIQTRRPIHIGDELAALGFVGVVKELNSRSVVIESFDGATVHLPNRQVLDSPFVNHTTVGARRSECEVRVRITGQAMDIAGALSEALLRVHGVLDDPEPSVFFTAADSDRVVLLARFWHSPSDARAVTSDVVHSVANSFHEAGHTATVIAPPPKTPWTALFVREDHGATGDRGQ